MAPVKGPKKPLKSMEKAIEKPISKSKKNKKKNYLGFAIYIYKLLKTIAKEPMRISRTSMVIMNSFVNDTLERIAVEAGRLVAHSKKTTMSSREIQSAIRLIIPGELATHANIEATKAITMYYKSREKTAPTKV
ncbi:unnamed protein product [Arctia plantaginis]|uniref:Core Histone H2A/H2B/H3 domain-containing protein n=1 Tax=Arctia plantaginis TaxID=874455 RepID=A0A8S1BK62_ARCPL|nr:unnamed protein product [Arctia plantaginis]CAB3262079.1 unnamed protein product [Arctia plantaginis]